MATNNTNTTVKDGKGCTQSHMVRNVIITVECLITIFSLIGNILVVAVVCRKTKLRTNVNYFITSMAISDLLIPTLFLPLRLTAFINDDSSFWIDGPFGEFTCRFVPYAVEVSIAVSILTMITHCSRTTLLHFVPVQGLKSKSQDVFPRYCYNLDRLLCITRLLPGS